MRTYHSEGDCGAYDHIIILHEPLLVLFPGRILQSSVIRAGVKPSLLEKVRSDFSVLLGGDVDDGGTRILRTELGRNMQPFVDPPVDVWCGLNGEVKTIDC